MAEAVPNDGGMKSNKDVIARFREEYKEGIAGAKVQEAHTNTDGWKALYSNHYEASKTKRRDLAKTLRIYADTLETRGLTEDHEKEVKNIVKASEALREQDAAFEVGTVEPATDSVSICEKLREKYKFEAESLEEREKMFNIGLAETMRMEIRRWPWPTLDRETGVVVVGLSKDM